MRTYKRVLKQVPDNIICDICGTNCTSTNFGTECAFVDAHWGYNSKKDGSQYEIHLCERCFDISVKYWRKIRSTYPAALNMIEPNKDPLGDIQ